MSERALGIYRAVVVGNEDPQGRGRVIVRVPQALGEVRSNWCEPTIPVTQIPALNEIVYVQFLNGDIAYPIYISR